MVATTPPGLPAHLASTITIDLDRGRRPRRAGAHDDFAIVSTEGFGRVTLAVSAAFLRWAAESPEWPAVAVRLAQAAEDYQATKLLDHISVAADVPQWPQLGERLAGAVGRGPRVDPAWCGAVGATTGRHCHYDVSGGPCPHHGEGAEAGCCGAATKSGTACRWSVVSKGPCPNHS